MRNVSRTALVPYSAEQMFALVANIAAYPEFLPWCTAADIHHENKYLVEASLQMQRNGVQKAFRTRNILRPFTAMDIELVGGPFTTLTGGWAFEQLGSDGSKVSLQLEFEFESRIIDGLFGAYFESTSASLVDSFTNRAKQVYDV